MERHAHYGMVGVITILLSIAAFGFSYWLIKGNVHEVFETYDVVFDTPVNGLTKGGEVHFNGIKVGEVASLKLGREDLNEVIATVKLDAHTPIHVDSRATLEPQGVTGLVFIQISPGSVKASRLTAMTPGYDHPVIKAEAATLDRLLQGSGSLISSALQSLDRVNKLLSDHNIKTLTKSLENVESVTEDLKARRKLLDDTHEAVVSASLAADAVTKLANSANTVMAERAPETFAKIDAASDRLAKASDEVARLSAAMEKPAQEVNDETLPQLEESLNRLNEATRNLNGLVDEARSSPQALIKKSKATERQVGQ